MAVWFVAGLAAASTFAGAPASAQRLPPPRGGSDVGVAAVPCDTYVPQSSPAAIAATPRADTNLERLAIAIGRTFTADPALYQRVVTDVAAIRALAPELANVPYRGRGDGRTLVLHVDTRTYDVMKEGVYLPWRCPNTVYGLRQTSFVEIGELRLVQLELKGIYDLDLLASEYGRLAGVLGAGPSVLAGGGSDICGTLEGSAVDGVAHYVFDQASGDCPAGCINHAYSHFTAAPGSAPVAAGTWARGDGAPPDWMRSWGACFAP